MSSADLPILVARGCGLSLGCIGAGTVDWVEGWRLWSGLELASVGLARHRALNVWDRAASDSGKRYSGWPDGDHCWGHELVVVDGWGISLCCRMDCY